MRWQSLGLLLVWCVVQGCIVQAADARSYLEDLHEFAPLWVEEFLEQEGRAWASLHERELDAIALEVCCFFPSRLAETFLDNREEFRYGLEVNKYGGERWRLLPWQARSLDYPFNQVVEAAKGTGKTRGILARIFFSLLKGGSVLFGAPTKTPINNVMEELIWQRDHSRNSEFLKQIVVTVVDNNNEKSATGPHGNTVKMITTEKGGKLFESCHLGRGGWVIADEAANWPEGPVWGKFLGRAEAGCRRLLCGTPNPPGPECRFFEIADSAIPLERAYLILEGQEADGPSAFDLKSGYARAHWSRPMLPEPHWGEEARAQAIQDFGPESSCDYRIFVLGLRASVAGVTFTGHLAESCFRGVPHRIVHVVVEGTAAQISVEVSEPPAHQFTTPGISFSVDDVYDRDDESSNLADDIIDLLALDSAEVIGVDAGRNVDPTEIVLATKTQTPGGLRVAARVELIRAPSGLQWRLIARMYHRLRPRRGIGIEASGGSLGQDIADNLVDRNAGKVPKRSVFAFEWRETEVVLERQQDGSRKKVERNLKEAATVAIERRLERAQKKPGYFVLPSSDQELKRQVVNHKTVGKGNKGRIFQEKDDDCLEALRAGVLAADKAKPGFRPGAGASAVGGGRT